MAYGIALLTAVLVASSSWAGGIPRSSILVKDAGNRFLEAKRYADAIDCYFQALELSPNFSEAHYNLGVAFLRGYNATPLALYHFEKYLTLEPAADDAEGVGALVATLKERARPVRARPGEVLGVVAGRLVVAGGAWLRPGDRLQVSEKGEAPCAHLLAAYVYPDRALSQRIRDPGVLDLVREGMLAVNTSEWLSER